MNLAVNTDPTDVLVVALREDNLDASNVREFRETMQDAMQSRSRVVLDMEGVKFIDSSGLGALISCLRQANTRQGDLRLAHISPTVQALFELMRMQRVFKSHETVAEAVASFN